MKNYPYHMMHGNRNPTGTDTDIKASHLPRRSGPERFPIPRSVVYPEAGFPTRPGRPILRSIRRHDTSRMTSKLVGLIYRSGSSLLVKELHWIFIMSQNVNSRNVFKEHDCAGFDFMNIIYGIQWRHCWFKTGLLWPMLRTSSGIRAER